MPTGGLRLRGVFPLPIVHARPNGWRLSCGALKNKSFLNLHAPRLALKRGNKEWETV